MKQYPPPVWQALKNDTERSRVGRDTGRDLPQLPYGQNALHACLRQGNGRFQDSRNQHTGGIGEGSLRQSLGGLQGESLFWPSWSGWV